MTILMTADTVGGVWTYALDLARALQPSGAQVHLATMGRLPSAAQCSEAAAVPNITLHESEFRLEWMESPWEDVARAGHWLLDLERTLQPEIVHLNGYAHGALPWKAPVVMVGHSCVLSWWRAVRGEDAPPEWAYYREQVTAGLATATAVVAPTEAMRAALERHYGPLSSSSVVPNGRDPALYSPGPKEPVILAAGRLWDEAKNIGTLAQAAAGLPWPVRIAGDAQGPDGGTAAFPNVQMLGSLPPETLAAEMRQAAIYALPARYEPFGLSALEAGLSGCALVLGDIPSLREVWGDAALFVPPDDAAALQQTLRELIADEPRRNALADRAQRRAQTYTLERMAQGYQHVYRQVSQHTLRRTIVCGS